MVTEKVRYTFYCLSMIWYTLGAVNNVKDDQTQHNILSADNTVLLRTASSVIVYIRDVTVPRDILPHTCRKIRI